MPARFRLSGGQFELHDADGVEIMSTAVKQFRWTDVLQGSHTFGLVATSPGETDRTQYLGPCHPDATILFGNARATGGTAGFSALPSTGWWCVSTSYLHSAWHSGDFAFMTQLMITYSFYIASGGVYLNERAVFGAFSTPTGQTGSYQPPLIEYELWCATLA